MSSVELLIRVLCVIAMTVECRYIPQAASHQPQRGRFLPNRRAFYNSILQRQNSKIRRNPLNTRFVSRAENLRQYQQNPARGHSAFDSVIKHSVHNLNRNAIYRNQIRSSKTKISQSNSAEKLNLFKNLPDRKRKLSINLKFNGHNSADDVSKNLRRNIQIETNNIHNLKISNAMKVSKIIIKNQGRNTRIHIARRPTSRTNSHIRNVHGPTTHQDKRNNRKVVMNHDTKTDVIKEHQKQLLPSVKYLQDVLKEKSSRKFDLVTLNPKAWIFTTQKPLKRITTDQMTSSVKATFVPITNTDSAISQTTEIANHTEKMITQPSGQTPLDNISMTVKNVTKSTRQIPPDNTLPAVSTTQIPFQSVTTEEIDLPDVPDLPEVPETADATYENSVFD